MNWNSIRIQGSDLVYTQAPSMDTVVSWHVIPVAISAPMFHGKVLRTCRLG